MLPLPLGEVAERSEDGEGEDGASVPQAERFFITKEEKNRWQKVTN